MPRRKFVKRERLKVERSITLLLAAHDLDDLDTRIPSQTEAETAQRVKVSLALQHLHLHELDRSERCESHPCRRFGIARALWELTVFGRATDTDDAILKLADQYLETAATLDRSIREVAKRALSLHAERERDHQVLLGEARSAREHAREQSISLPELPTDRIPDALDADLLRFESAIFEPLSNLAKELRKADCCLREKLANPAHWLPRGSKRDPLVIAVTQHLHHGGFTAREIAELIDDGEGDNTREKRVCDRLRPRNEDERMRWEGF